MRLSGARRIAGQRIDGADLYGFSGVCRKTCRSGQCCGGDDAPCSVHLLLLGYATAVRLGNRDRYAPENRRKSRRVVAPNRSYSPISLQSACFVRRAVAWALRPQGGGLLLTNAAAMPTRCRFTASPRRQNRHEGTRKSRPAGDLARPTGDFGVFPPRRRRRLPFPAGKIRWMVSCRDRQRSPGACPGNSHGVVMPHTMTLRDSDNCSRRRAYRHLGNVVLTWAHRCATMSDLKPRSGVSLPCLGGRHERHSL